MVKFPIWRFEKSAFPPCHGSLILLIKIVSINVKLMIIQIMSEGKV